MQVMEKQPLEVQDRLRKSYRILIVEDEILIADTIKRYLITKGYQVVGIAISYEEAKELYLATEPDMVLLDIRLNGIKTGIDVAHFIKNHTYSAPFIYLSSQLDSLSLGNAKETFPAGYLSKPLHKESLYTSIEIAMHKYREQGVQVPSIELFDGTKRTRVKIDDILYLQAEHVYLGVHLTGERKIVQRSTFKDFLEQLPEDQFIQTHRSFAVNMKQIRTWDHSNLYVQDKKIPISRSRRKKIQDLLGFD